MKIEAKHSFTFWISSLLPLMFMNDDCWPANDASAWSSAVADERTETKTGSRDDLRIDSAPGEFFISLRSTLKWSYASMISTCRFCGISDCVISSRISLAFVVRALVSSTLIWFRMSLIFCSSFASLRKWKNASVVTTNAWGTGNFALNISPRFAPLPPASLRSFLERSESHAMYLSPMSVTSIYYI